MTITRNLIVPQIEPRGGSTNPPLITTVFMPAAEVAVPYSVQMTATGGIPPYTWSVASSSPDTTAGITSGGLVQWTPQTIAGNAGSETINIQVTDSLNAPTAPTAFSVTVFPQLVITTSSLPSATAGTAYSATLTATGGLQPYAWSISGQDVNGFPTLNPATGALSGTPGQGETLSLVVTVTDALGGSASNTFPLTVTGTQTGLGPQAMWPGLIQSSQLLISWWPPTSGAPTSYNVYRNGAKINAIPVVPLSYTQFGVPCLSYTDTGLAPNTTYTYTVTAVTNGVESSPGPALPMTTLQLLSATGGVPTPPAPPIAWAKPTYKLPTGGATWVCNTSADFSNALANASYGDVIQLTAGNQFTIPTNGFTMNPWKGSAANGPVYIISSQIASLPAPGTRVSPANTVNMPAIVTTTHGAGLHIAAGVSQAYFAGINFMPAPSDQTTNLNSCVAFTASAAGSPDVTPASNFTFDRCVFGNDSTLSTYSWITKGIGAVCNFLLVDSCYMYGFFNNQVDTQTVNIVAGGPVTINNCYLEASGENVMTGGTYVGQSQVAHDIVISNNLMVKPLSWIPTVIGNNPKNHIEFKYGIRAAVFNNTLQNCWLGSKGGQNGHSTSSGVSDQQSFAANMTLTCPWIASTDHDWYNNVITGVGDGHHFYLENFVPSGYVARCRFRNNLIHVNPPTGQGTSNGNCGEFGGGAADIIFDHNTVIIYPNNLQSGGVSCSAMEHIALAAGQFTGRIDDGGPTANANAGNVLTVSLYRFGPYLGPGTYLYNLGTPLTAGTRIVAQLSGTTGQAGTYQINNSQNVTAQGMAQSNYAPQVNVSDRTQVTNNIFDGVFALRATQNNGAGITPSGGSAAATLATAFGTNFVWSNNVNVTDSSNYGAGNATAGSYAALGMANFVNNQTPPVNLGDWNVVSGTYATFSQTGGPVGAILPPPPALDAFPRTAINMVGGSPNLMASGNTNAGVPFSTVVQQSSIVAMGNYLGYEAAVGTTVQSLVSGWKSSAATNSLTLRATSYVPGGSAYYALTSTPSGFGWLANALAQSNMWLYNSAAGSGNTSLQLYNGFSSESFPLFTTVNTQTVPSFTYNGKTGVNVGLNVWNVNAQYYWDVFSRGLSSSTYGDPTQATIPALDGLFVDNMMSGPWPHFFTTTSSTWNGQGTTPFPNSSVLPSSLQIGESKLVTAFKAQNPNILLIANSDYANHLPTLDPSNSKLWPVIFQEDTIGNLEAFQSSPGQFMSALISAEALLAPGGTLIFHQATSPGAVNNLGGNQSTWGATQWRSVRFGFAAAMMRNYHYAFNCGQGQYSSVGLMDEQFQSNSYNWLSAGTQRLDPPQSAAFANGVWRRRFPNGWVLWNPRGNGTQVVTVPTTLSRLTTRGYGDATVNTGATVSGGTVTLQDADGLFLIGTG